jgi:phosphoglycerol transferase MdoB-like AlkP superfamily enzyme
MTDTPQPGAAEASLPAGLGRFANSFFPRSFSARDLLQSPHTALLAGGLLLPNLLSLATLSTFVDIGLPPRTGAIFLYTTLAICARRIPFAATALLFVAVLAFDMVRTLSLMFGLAPSELMAALDHARRINFFASPLYVTLISVVAATSFSSLYFLGQRTKLVRGNINMLFSAALIFASLDYVTNVSAHYQFGSMFGHDKPIASAADVSGFNAVAGTNGRNVVVVIVESLGYMLDPAARMRIAGPLYDQQIAQKYVVTSGSTTYYGSTTAGEMRELCDTRVFYAEYVRQHGASCLPRQLHRRGYVSLAVHGFSGGMFGRQFWYPGLGFDKAIFGDKLVKESARLCGSAFRGVCDADLAPVIAKEAKQLGSPDKPRFIYWLTLNTHIPVAPDDALTDFDCLGANNQFVRPAVCRMAELWHDFFAAVSKLALDPSIAPAEILIVGDHAPPLWSKRGRAEFAAGKVAWYRLTPRAAVASTPTP